MNYQTPLNKALASAGHSVMVDGTMIRKGVSGDGKASLDEAQQARWAKAEEEQFGADPELLAWARAGGGSF